MNKIESPTVGKKWTNVSLRQRRDNAAFAVSECRYRRLFESAKDGILILDAEDGMVLDVNPFLIELLGYSHEEFVGKAIWDLGFFRDAIANRENFLELQEKGYIRYENLPLESVAGRHVNVEFISNVYPEGDKNVIQCNIRDITARKQVENFHEMGRDIMQILNVSNKPHDALTGVLSALKTGTGFDSVGIRILDEDASTDSSQPVCCDHLLRMKSLFNDGGKVRFDNDYIGKECLCGLVASGRTDPSNPLFTPGGSFWTNDSRPWLQSPSNTHSFLSSCNNECIHQGNAAIALVPIRNMGLLQLKDRRRGLLNLEMVELLEEIAAHLGAALLRQKAEQELERISRLASEDPNPVLRVSVRGILEYANAASDLLVRMMGSYIGGPVNAEWLAHIHSAVTAKHPRHIECEVAGRTFDITFAPFINCDYVNLYALDITKQKRAVEQHDTLQSQLNQVQKMESVGRLAGGVAHDFNNMLSIILGQIGIAMERVPPPGPLFDSLYEIQQAAKKSAELVQQLMAFARQQNIEPKVINPDRNISGMIGMLRHLIGEDLMLKWKPGAGAHTIRIDPSQFDQILANLCVNARDAIENTGTISLKTGNIVIDSDYCALHVEAIPGSYLFLAVSDDGSGMDETTLEHIFEPFFTTKTIGKGTGLGLATVYGIVKQNNGFVNAYSEPGEGSTFRIYLPLVEESKAAKIAVATATAPQGQGETVLLVEDNPALQNVYQQFLKRLGYTLLSAQTPEEALRLAAHHPDIKLLLTDVVMPGMNGRQLAEKIKRSNPDIQILFMSGYTADILADRGVQENHMHFIGKPFTRDELACKVREMLLNDCAAHQTSSECGHLLS